MNTMNTTPNDGGPAFPRAGFLSEIEARGQLIAQYENKPEQGMSLRDYFASAALTGLLARPNSEGLLWASEAYEQADAMIDERNKVT